MEDQRFAAIADAPRRAMQTRIAARFRRRAHRVYTRFKLALDPVFEAVGDLNDASDRPLLDIGCGLGLLGLYLRERGFRGQYLGLDTDASKVCEAAHVARDIPEFTVKVGDAAVGLPEFSGDIALIDVLHYLGAADQRRLLHDAAARVSPTGRLIVRSVLRARHWRFRATVWEEHLARTVGWTPGAAYYPALEDIEAPLRAAGMRVESHPLWGRTPFNSYLIVASRDAS